jgi:hypothetical protein
MKSINKILLIFYNESYLFYEHDFISIHDLVFNILKLAKKYDHQFLDSIEQSALLNQMNH